MTHKKLKIAVTVISLAACAVANAQTSPIRPSYQYPDAPAQSGAASVQIPDTPLFFTPYVGLAVGHDDNVLLTNTNKTSSTLYVVSPGFKLDARSPGLVYQGSYQGQIGQYQDSSDDNYVDHVVRNQLDLAFSGRSFLRVGYDFIRSHDPRGSTDRGVSTRPDKYQLISPSATYAFGAPGAQGRMELYWTDSYKTYMNNRSTTRLSDRDTRDLGSAFYWRVMPKTYLVLDVRGTDVDYRATDSLQSSTERRYLVGVSWNATAATSGTFKVGRLKKDFDSGNTPGFSGTSWEGTITWAPRTYSSVDFYTARTTNESTGLGTFILSDIYGVSWNHSWSSVVSTGVNLRHQRDEYQGFDRSDKANVLGLKAGYRFRRWLTFGAEYVYTKRDSSQNSFDYDKNLYLLTATASM